MMILSVFLVFYPKNSGFIDFSKKFLPESTMPKPLFDLMKLPTLALKSVVRFSEPNEVLVVFFPNLKKKIIFKFSASKPQCPRIPFWKSSKNSKFPPTISRLSVRILESHLYWVSTISPLIFTAFAFHLKLANCKS